MSTEKPSRCPWSEGISETYRDYHDNEWGVPARDDARQFEFLVLESAQAGLSWATVLHKREGYRAAFAGFDPARVSRFDRRRIDRLVANPAIIRNRAKIEAAVHNARLFLDIAERYGSFASYIWDFVDGTPIQNAWRTQSSVPATSAESDALSRDMRGRGFKFVGSTIMYAHMQATGLVNDHVVDCYRHRECGALAHGQRASN